MRAASTRVSTFADCEPRRLCGGVDRYGAGPAWDAAPRRRADKLRSGQVCGRVRGCEQAVCPLLRHGASTPAADLAPAGRAPPLDDKQYHVGKALHGDQTQPDGRLSAPRLTPGRRRTTRAGASVGAPCPHRVECMYPNRASLPRDCRTRRLAGVRVLRGSSTLAPSRHCCGSRISPGASGDASFSRAKNPYDVERLGLGRPRARAPRPRPRAWRSGPRSGPRARPRAHHCTERRRGPSRGARTSAGAARRACPGALAAKGRHENPRRRSQVPG